MAIVRTTIPALIYAVVFVTLLATASLFASELDGKRLFFSAEQRADQQQGTKAKPPKLVNDSQNITDPAPVRKDKPSITYSGFIRIDSHTVYFINGKPANESVYLIKRASRQGDRIKVRLADNRLIELHIGKPLVMGYQ